MSEEGKAKIVVRGREYTMTVRYLDDDELPKIEVIADEACPGCGAVWGHEDPKLDFPNRQKVDDFWRCYNPECEVGYYNPETGEIELWR